MNLTRSDFYSGCVQVSTIRQCQFLFVRLMAIRITGPDNYLWTVLVVPNVPNDLVVT